MAESFEDFQISVGVSGSGPFGSPNCRWIATEFAIRPGWNIDTTRGDPGHPGVSEIANASNEQANRTLHNYSYAAVAPDRMRVDGEICGAPWWGLAAAFDRSFRVFTVSSRPVEPAGQGQEDFHVSGFARSGAWPWDRECRPISLTYTVAPGRVIDVTRGDPGHAGVSEVGEASNMQAVSSLRDYRYGSISDVAVEVAGMICGAAWWGASAIFERDYRVYTRPT